jgi:hypothetical protein
VELNIGAQPGADEVNWKLGESDSRSQIIEKTRPDDFIEELKHLESVLQGQTPNETIELTQGLETMLVIAAVHLSAREARNIRIDYDVGYTLDALGPA